MSATPGEAERTSNSGALEPASELPTASLGGRLSITPLLEQALSWIVVPVVLSLISIGAASIVLRFVWNGAYALFWAEEVIRYGFAWVFWLVAPIAIAQGSTFTVEMLVDVLPPRMKLVVMVAGHAAVMVLLGLYVYHGVSMTRVNALQLSTALEIPMSYAYAAIPTGAALMFCVLAVRIVETLGGASRSHGRGERR